MSSRRRALPLVAWVAALTASLGGMSAAGTVLPTPPVTQPSLLPDYLAGTAPLLGAFGILRVIALALGWYLLASTLLATVSRLLRAARLVRVADWLTLPPVRRLVQAAVGIGMAAATVGALSNGGEQAWYQPSEAVVAYADATEPGLQVVPEGEIGGPTLGLERIAPAQTADATLEATDGPALWVVAPGDHLWSIAERVLAAHHGSAPDEATVVTYWQRLVDANRERLADPTNPDLIYPEQELVLPPVE